MPIFAALIVFYFCIISALCTAQPLFLKKTAPEAINPPSFTLTFLRTEPHSPNNFTQGLFFKSGQLIETTGKYGQSRLIEYDHKDLLTPLKQIPLDAAYFGEGSTVFNDEIFYLTWKSGKAFKYTGNPAIWTQAFTYEGEGWGLTANEDALWMSNGSNQLRYLNPDGSLIKTINVRYKGNSIDRLNELEWVNGYLFANRWFDHRLFIINPENGDVIQVFDLSALSQREVLGDRNKIVNGIAYEVESNELWLTGKNWANFYVFALGQTPAVLSKQTKQGNTQRLK